MRPRSAAAANSDVHVSKWHHGSRHRRQHRRVEINNFRAEYGLITSLRLFTDCSRGQRPLLAVRTIM